MDLICMLLLSVGTRSTMETILDAVQALVID
jgi:hypothetical protein